MMNTYWNGILVQDSKFILGQKCNLPCHRWSLLVHTKWYHTDHIKIFTEIQIGLNCVFEHFEAWWKNDLNTKSFFWRKPPTNFVPTLYLTKNQNLGTWESLLVHSGPPPTLNQKYN